MKTQREILDAVRVCDETLTKRLREFEVREWNRE